LLVRCWCAAGALLVLVLVLCQVCGNFFTNKTENKTLPGNPK
jgi:uncharacterized protein YneF (UPF0154 family)